MTTANSRPLPPAGNGHETDPPPPVGPLSQRPARREPDNRRANTEAQSHRTNKRIRTPARASSGEPRSRAITEGARKMITADGPGRRAAHLPKNPRLVKIDTEAVPTREQMHARHRGTESATEVTRQDRERSTGTSRRWSEVGSQVDVPPPNHVHAAGTDIPLQELATCERESSPWGASGWAASDRTRLRSGFAATAPTPPEQPGRDGPPPQGRSPLYSQVPASYSHDTQAWRLALLCRYPASFYAAGPPWARTIPPSEAELRV